MSNFSSPFEIHVHGDVPVRPEVSYEQLQEALKPMWKYAGARSLAAGAASAEDKANYFNTGFQLGSIAMRSVLWDGA